MILIIFSDPGTSKLKVAKQVFNRTWITLIHVFFFVFIIRLFSTFFSNLFPLYVMIHEGLEDLLS